MADTQAQPADDRQWLLHGDLPCLQCQYNLRGLVGPVVKCPECGHANDLRDPRPWRTKKLPTGVLVREHWPASAALASFLVMIVLPFALLSVKLLSVGGLSFVALGAVIVTPAVLTWWVLSCVRWLRSCDSQAWGWGVLVGTHLAMWGVLWGAVAVPAVVLEWQSPMAWLGGAVFLAAVAAFFWLRRVIRQADETGQFRSDWRRWQVPTEMNQTMTGATKGGQDG